jgi:hypothetical protein
MLHPIPVEKLTAENDDITATYLPPNDTSLAQAMDRGVIETIKRLYRKDLMMDLITEEKNPLLFWKSLKITDTVYSISTV